VAEGNGKSSSVSWQSLAGFAVAIAMGLVAFVGKGMSDNLSNLDGRVWKIEQHLDDDSKGATRRDEEASRNRADIDALKDWQKRTQWEKENAQHKREINLLDTKVKKREVAVKEKTYQLKHQREHADHEVKALTKELVDKSVTP
jgi:hypothetical protein